MDFFESQAAARRRTVVLVFYYFLATLVVIPLVYLVVLAAAVPVRSTLNFFREWYDFHNTHQPTPRPGWWDALLFFRVAFITLLVMLGGTIFRLWQLSKGGYVVAEMLGGELVEPGTQNAAHRRLLNVVEEMAIASGLPVPDVYLLGGQHGINAFAAGFTPDDAVIGVTRGCIDILSRDELQGVVAHEFSHIMYGDMRLKTILMGLLHGLVYIGFMSNHACTEGVKGDPAMASLAFFAFVVFGAVTLPLLLVLQIGIALSGAIKRMVSRQREYLADAAAVQFTRNPDGIVGALKKVGGLTAGSRVLGSRMSPASHFFFANALGHSVLSLPGLASHPPLTERIRRIDPHFAGEFEHVSSRPIVQDTPAVEAGALEQALTFGVEPGAIAGSIGSPSGQHVALAATLLAAFPPQLTEAIRTPGGARGVVYALLLNPDPAPRRLQLEQLRGAADPHVAAETQKAMLLLGAMKGERRLPLASMAVRSLKALSADEYTLFRDNVDALIAADDKVDLFEFALGRTIMRRLAPAFEKQKPDRAPRVQTLKPLLPACRNLLSCLACWGSYNLLDQDQAYHKGMAILAEGATPAPEMPAQDDCTVETAAAALDEMAHAAPAVKKQILDACVTCIAADGQTSVAESELLQAVADSLDCPMPPIG